MSTPVTTSSKRWDLSIEMLKAIAALLVMNSHMDAMYGEYSFLETGGAIGDALFFFAPVMPCFLVAEKRISSIGTSAVSSEYIHRC